MDFSTLCLVCPLVFLGGFVDAVGGGGALIALPAYLLAGIPPHVAIGTNKLSSSLGKAASLFKLARSGFVDWKLAPLPVAVSFIGSFIGASFALSLPPEIFETILLVLLPVVALVVLRKRDKSARYVEMPLARRIAILSGCSFVCNAYDGFYGPGSGTFLLVSFSTLAGLDIRQAAGQTKVVNIAGAATAFVAYAWAGQVDWVLGLAAGLFGIAGHYLGATLVVKNGSAIVRPVILLVLCALFVKTLLQ